MHIIITMNNGETATIFFEEKDEHHYPCVQLSYDRAERIARQMDDEGLPLEIIKKTLDKRIRAEKEAEAAKERTKRRALDDKYAALYPELAGYANNLTGRLAWREYATGKETRLSPDDIARVLEAPDYAPRYADLAMPDAEFKTALTRERAWGEEHGTKYDIIMRIIRAL